MNPAILLLAVGYGYLAGNERARNTTLRQVQKIAGMAVDGLNRQGGSYVPKPEEPEEQPEQPDA